MADRRASSNSNSQQIKLVLIPALGIVLLIVLFSSGEKPATVLPVVASPTTTNAIKPTAPMPILPKSPTIDWPSSSLSEVLAHNPFAIPESLKTLAKQPLTPKNADQSDQLTDSKTDQSEELKEALNGRKLQGLIKTARGFVALIGDDVVREGDVIDGKIRVKSIQTEGVELELVPGG